MLRIVLTILVHLCYHSLGMPTLNSYSTLLYNLGNSCVHPDIKSNILKNVDLCSGISRVQHYKCAMFYDINRRLCAVVGTPPFKNADLSPKLDNTLDSDQLCSRVNNWVISNLTEEPDYKEIVESILKKKCTVFCGVEDITSTDTNYYCQYFDWGDKVLKSVTMERSPVKVAPELNNNIKPNIEPVDIPINVNSSERVSKALEPSAPVKPIELNPADKSILEQTSTSKQTSNQTTAKVNEQDNIVNAQPKPQVESDPLKKSEESPDVPNNQVGKPEESKPPVGENPNDFNNQDEDFGDGDSPGNEDIDGGEPEPEDETQAKGNAGEQSQKKDAVTPKSTKKEHEEDKIGFEEEGKGSGPKVEPVIPSYSREISHREFYPSSIQDGYPEEEDHFFTFFLTAIIMVVLIYVLYHNKNKVGKLFFGLLLEGRQSSRRRNSRGHAYRRLDTLEQAMSSNTAAPPSKIIY